MLGRARARRRFVVAVSGVDGSGKSTLTRQLVLRLNEAGIPACRVWGRPGHGLGAIGDVAPLIKKVLRAPSSVGTRQVVAGPRSGGGLPRSRRGLLGWAWSSIVTIAYLLDVRRQHVFAASIVVYDRHHADALVTLDFLYGCARRRFPRALVRLLLPPADLAYYLEVDAETVLERTAGSPFGRYAAEQQLQLYPQRLAPLPVEHLDGSEEPDALVEHVYERILEAWDRQLA